MEPGSFHSKALYRRVAHRLGDRRLMCICQVIDDVITLVRVGVSVFIRRVRVEYDIVRCVR